MWRRKGGIVRNWIWPSGSVSCSEIMDLGGYCGLSFFIEGKCTFYSGSTVRVIRCWLPWIIQAKWTWRRWWIIFKKEIYHHWNAMKYVTLGEFIVFPWCVISCTVSVQYLLFSIQNVVFLDGHVSLANNTELARLCIAEITQKENRSSCFLYKWANIPASIPRRLCIRWPQETLGW